MSHDVSRRLTTIVASAIALLSGSVAARAQTVDPGFNPGANQVVWSMALQPDGKILVGGSFTGLGAATGTTTRNHIGRLNADGSVDSELQSGHERHRPRGGGAAGWEDPGRRQLHVGRRRDRPDDAPQPHRAAQRRRLGRHQLQSGREQHRLRPGRAAGREDPGRRQLHDAGRRRHRHDDAQPRSARLNADGSLDSFNPGASKVGGVPIVYTMALQPDGKIVVGGYFNGLGGGTGTTLRNYIGRLNADGTLDTGFNPGATFIVNALALQADGKILVGGDFIGLGGGDGSGRSRAATSGGSTPTARSTSASIRARKRRSTRWACRPTGRSSSAGTSSGWAVRAIPCQVGAQLHRAAQRRRLGRCHLQSGRGQHRRRAWRSRPTGRSWPAAVFSTSATGLA